MVARVLWEHDVAGSNPVIPTKKVFVFNSGEHLFSFWSDSSLRCMLRIPNLVSPSVNVAFRPKKHKPALVVGKRSNFFHFGLTKNCADAILDLTNAVFDGGGI